MTGEQLSTIAAKFTNALIGVGSDMRLSSVDLATVIAVAAVNINVRVHGTVGLEHVRTTADVAERQLLDDGAVS